MRSEIAKECALPEQLASVLSAASPAALQHVPIAAVLIDNEGVVRHISRLYEEIASGNSRLPLVGQRWSETRGRIDLSSNGHASYEVTALPMDDQVKLVVLRLQPEDDHQTSR